MGDRIPTKSVLEIEKGSLKRFNLNHTMKTTLLEYDDSTAMKDTRATTPILYEEENSLWNN